MDLSQPLPDLASTIAKILRDKDAPIFRRGSLIVTVSKRGKIEPMTPERFTSWVGKYLTFTLPGKDAETFKSTVKKMAHSALELPS